MVKNGGKVVFHCVECGHSEPKWFGRCPSCMAWNTSVEEIKTPVRSQGHISLTDKSIPVSISQIPEDKVNRTKTGISEFDRVLGGGIVPGMTCLLGGEPGIGKSTLILQLCNKIASRGNKVLYISGEESHAQIKLRANRLGTNEADIHLLTETSLDDILASLENFEGPIGLIALDSIQSTYWAQLSSAPGTVSQVRECAGVIMRWCKSKGYPLLLIGHVTKEGTIAGPKVLEHMVDTVLYMEGDRHHQYRILRTVKNRFGSTNEVGIFEMRTDGLSEINNPSRAFLLDHKDESPGSVITVSNEGSRALVVEIQALTASSDGFGAPRRNTSGIDHRKLAMLIAVMDKRVGLSLSRQDIFVNAVGGATITEPAADLAICMAITSSLRETPLPRNMVVIGEVGLGGELRPVGGMDRRLSEAAALGFNYAIIPNGGVESSVSITTTRAHTLEEALAEAAAMGAVSVMEERR